MRTSLIGLALALAVTPALADGSYLLPDGTNRAPAVTLHCAGSTGVALPCGNAATPLVVTSPVGSATASNQTAQLAAEQASAQGIGTAADNAYGGGAGTLTSLLKGIWSVLNGGVAAVPVGGAPTSRSVALPAAQSATVFPANPLRRYIAFQAPQNTAIWVNFLGGPANPNGADCAYFAAGALYESGQWVNRGAITVYAPVAVAFSAWEN